MKRPLTSREKVLLLILILVVLIFAFLKLFFSPINERQEVAQQRIAQAQEAWEGEQLKLAQIDKMEGELERARMSESYQFSEIPYYDNIDNVMVQLDGILGTAREYQLNFSKIELGELLVSRPIQMTFTASNYRAAKEILTDLYASPYRCSLRGITIFTDVDRAGQGDITTQPVSVTLTATFYEKYKDDEAKEAAARAAGVN